MNVLIIVDAQNDFLPGGALAVPNGDRILPVINELLKRFELIIFTKDWHPENHKSFASQWEGKNVLDVVDLNGLPQVLWPDHCVQETLGAEISEEIDFGLIKGNFYFFKKGMNAGVDSYSGFYENDKQYSTGLTSFLKEKSAEKVFVVGLALDYCVKFTAIDSANEGFKTYVIAEGTKAITEDTTGIINELYDNNVDYVKLEELENIL